jgi:hypothetical protein
MDSKKRIKVVGNLGQGHEAQNVHDPSGIAPTVREMHGKVTKIITDVSGQTTLTNTPAKSTENTMKKSANKTSGQLTLLSYQNTTSCVRDFLAKVSLLLGSEKDLKILEAHSSLRYAESYGLKDLAIYSLRMSKDSSPTMTELPSKPLSERWMNWGMTANGKCLTARITVSRKTEKGCSLSDILEDNPDQKYFLSEKQTKYIQKQMNKSATPLTAIITKDG